MKFTGSIGSLFQNRTVLIPILILGLVGVAFGMSTLAFYTDADQSTSNPVQGGTMNLSIDGADSLSSSFSITSAAPSDAGSHTFAVANEGPVVADHVEVTVAVAESDSGGEPGDPDLGVELNATEAASLVKVQTYEYRNSTGTVITDFTTGVTDANGNDIIDLEDVSEQSSVADDLPAPQANHGNETSVAIDLRVANDDSSSFTAGGNTAGNLTGYDEDFMADGVDVTITVRLNQDASQ